MRRHLRKPGVWIAALIVLALWLLWPRPVSSPPLASLPGPTQTTSESVPSADPMLKPAPTLLSFLPREADDTIRLIQSNGRFPHRQDGGVFANREGLLPPRPGGYYREYTVDTPGVSHRGARRIITGGRPPEVWYYTDDHYDSFRAFAVPAMGRMQ